MRVERASSQAIEYACKHFHYAGRSHYLFVGYNVYNEANEWCGVVCFARGAINCAKEFGLVNGEAAELVRVALNGKQATTSQAVMLAVRQFAKDAPLVQVLVSYADLGQGHLGTIYQATNWLYVGQIKGRPEWRTKAGQLIHGREVTRSGVLRRAREGTVVACYKTEEVDRLPGHAKHKYIFPLASYLRKQLQSEGLPYPKKGQDD